MGEWIFIAIFMFAGIAMILTGLDQGGTGHFIFGGISLLLSLCGVVAKLTTKKIIPKEVKEDVSVGYRQELENITHENISIITQRLDLHEEIYANLNERIERHEKMLGLVPRALDNIQEQLDLIAMKKSADVEFMEDDIEQE